MKQINVPLNFLELHTLISDLESAIWHIGQYEENAESETKREIFRDMISDHLKLKEKLVGYIEAARPLFTDR